jgi:hypothetical protein
MRIAVGNIHLGLDSHRRISTLSNLCYYYTRCQDVLTIVGWSYLGLILSFARLVTPIHNMYRALQTAI